MEINMVSEAREIDCDSFLLDATVLNSQGRNLGRSVCLLELPVCLAQKGDLGESGKGIFTSQSD